MYRNQTLISYDTLASDLVSYLKKLGYSQSRINTYRICIKTIRTFMEQEELKLYNAKTCAHYIEHVMNNNAYQDLTRNDKDKIRCANAMLEYQLTGTIAFRSWKKSIDYHGIIGKVILDYLLYRKSRNISKDTLDSNRLYLVRFQEYLENHGLKDLKDISQEHILGFIKSLSFYSKATIHCMLCTLRGFLRYLQSQEILEMDWSYLVPKDNYKKEAKLPTTYTKEEIEAIINAIDRGNPKGKRDYAIILLAARLGLRASDICRMTFENLLWEQNLIIFSQQKTGNRIELPLLTEIGNAIIDYLKYGRPESESSYIFLHVNPRYERLQEPTIHSIVTQYMRLAGIRNISKKKHGPHALRHSLAGFLLEKKTPLPIISEVLGHTNTETTKTYLRIDVESLRQCALDVPMFFTAFYEEGRC